MASVAIFDMNETTLDLAPVRDAVDGVLQREGAFGMWFGRLLQTSMAITATGRYDGFGALGKAALESVAQSYGADLPSDGWDRVGAAMAGIAPYPDVIAGLDSLKAAGWRLIALTNSAPASVDAQVANAGLQERFEAVLSVESVAAFKPAAAPYRHALDVAGVDAGEAVMVAAHDWDLAGAKAVGMETAFIARPAMPFSSAFPAADYSAADFVELAAALGATTKTN